MFGLVRFGDNPFGTYVQIRNAPTGWVQQCPTVSEWSTMSTIDNSWTTVNKTVSTWTTIDPIEDDTEECT